jgi:hypothetical protein
VLIPFIGDLLFKDINSWKYSENVGCVVWKPRAKPNWSCLRPAERVSLGGKIFVRFVTLNAPASGDKKILKRKGNETASGDKKILKSAGNAAESGIEITLKRLCSTVPVVEPKKQDYHLT